METEKKEEQAGQNYVPVKKDIEKSTSDNSVVNNTMLFIVGILVVMSGVQVFQMQSISKALTNGPIKSATQTQGSVTGLPSQVGGCG